MEGGCVMVPVPRAPRVQAPDQGNRPRPLEDRVFTLEQAQRQRQQRDEEEFQRWAGPLIMQHADHLGRVDSQLDEHGRRLRELERRRQVTDGLVKVHEHARRTGTRKVRLRDVDKRLHIVETLTQLNGDVSAYELGSFAPGKADLNEVLKNPEMADRMQKLRADLQDPKARIISVVGFETTAPCKDQNDLECVNAARLRAKAVTDHLGVSDSFIQTRPPTDRPDGRKVIVFVETNK